MKTEKFLKEFARDVIALGSPVFFILVLARIFLLSYFFKSNLYSGLGLIVLVFTTLYYTEIRFTIFAVFLYFLLVASLFYLKKEKSEIIKGIFFALISAGVSYYFVRIL